MEGMNVGTLAMLVALVVLTTRSYMKAYSLQKRLDSMVKDLHKVRSRENKAVVILERVSLCSGQNPEILRRKSRKEDIVAARALYFIVCRREGITDDCAAKQIGFDRTMAVHYNRHYKKSDTYKIYKRNYERNFGS